MRGPVCVPVVRTEDLRQNMETRQNKFGRFLLMRSIRREADEAWQKTQHAANEEAWRWFHKVHYMTPLVTFKAFMNYPCPCVKMWGQKGGGASAACVDLSHSCKTLDFDKCYVNTLISTTTIIIITIIIICIIILIIIIIIIKSSYGNQMLLL